MIRAVLSAIFCTTLSFAAFAQTIPNQSAPIEISSAGTLQIIPPVSGGIINIFSTLLTGSGAGTAKLVYGTGTNCSSGQTDLTGAMVTASSTPIPIVAELFVPASQEVCIISTGSANPQGAISYYQPAGTPSLIFCMLTFETIPCPGGIN